MKTLEQQLMEDEGFGLKGAGGKVYRDIEGHLTIGYGRNLESIGLSEKEAYLVLRRDPARLKLSTPGTIQQLAIDSLKQYGITPADALELLKNDTKRVKEEVHMKFGTEVASLSPVRKNVIYNMAFNLGITKLEKFQKMWGALRGEAAGSPLKDSPLPGSPIYELAADEMLDSKWATQVKSRAIRLATQMRQNRP